MAITPRQQEALSLRASGMTYEQIGAHFGMTEASASRLCRNGRRAIGLPCEYRSRTEISEYKRRVTELYDSGMSEEQIAASLGKTLNAIRHVLRSTSPAFLERRRGRAQRQVARQDRASPLVWQGDASLVPLYEDADVSFDQSRLVSIRAVSL